MDCRSKFITNMFENTIMSSMFKSYGEDMYDKCFMDVSTQDTYVPFFLNLLQASLVTSVCSNQNCKSHQGLRKIKYVNNGQVDILCFDLDERVGAFKEQYDIINAFDTLDYYTDPHRWQASVENLFFYLKPGGLCFINWTFYDKEVKGTTVTRSDGIWRAISNKCGCRISSIIENPTGSLCENEKIMVIRK